MEVVGGPRQRGLTYLVADMEVGGGAFLGFWRAGSDLARSDRPVATAAKISENVVVWGSSTVATFGYRLKYAQTSVLGFSHPGGLLGLLGLLHTSGQRGCTPGVQP